MLQTRELIEMIRKVRFNKIDSGLQMLQGPMTVKLNNLSAMEINTIRPFFAGALNQFWKLSKVCELLIWFQLFKSFGCMCIELTNQNDHRKPAKFADGRARRSFSAAISPVHSGIR